MNRTLIQHLNRELASIQILLLNAKYLHWMVVGPHFRDYHLRFDELYASVLPMMDALGERIRQLDGIPLHAPADLERESGVPVAEGARLRDAAAMAAKALSDVEAVCALMHEGIDRATEAEDPGSADLLTGFVQVLQKEAWFLRSMLA